MVRQLAGEPASSQSKRGLQILALSPGEVLLQGAACLNLQMVLGCQLRTWSGGVGPSAWHIIGPKYNLLNE